jgi:hypothetical protein
MMSTDSAIADSLLMQAARFVWRRTGKRVIAVARATARVSRNAAMRCLCRADYKRWGSAQGLEEWWDQRTQQIAAYVPAGSRVIEFGAGRRSMEKMLPAGCVYTPSDLVDRGPGTIVCDLNQRPLPDLSNVKPQVAAFSGVLEYIQDSAALAQWLAASGVTTIITSYDAVPTQFTGIRRMRENLRRSYYGYMSSMTEPELESAFERAGYSCTNRQTWTTQRIYRFETKQGR